MAKLRDLNQALEKYKSSGNNEFFTLDNDKDSAVVRFLIGEELIPEEDWFIAHEVEIGGKKRWVQCTEEGDCPLCVSGNKATLKLFLQLVDKRDGKIKTWERGQTFVPKITGLQNKYGALCNRPYEIERHGKKGDTQTKYEIYPLDKDEKTLADLPEKQVLLGPDAFILQKSFNEMQLIAEGKYNGPTQVQTERRQSSSGSSDRPRRDSDIF